MSLIILLLYILYEFDNIIILYILYRNMYIMDIMDIKIYIYNIII
jgi:hypothetical protein